MIKFLAKGRYSYVDAAGSCLAFVLYDHGRTFDAVAVIGWTMIISLVVNVWAKRLAAKTGVAP